MPPRTAPEDRSTRIPAPQRRRRYGVRRRPSRASGYDRNLAVAAVVAVGCRSTASDSCSPLMRSAPSQKPGRLRSHARSCDEPTQAKTFGPLQRVGPNEVTPTTRQRPRTRRASGPPESPTYALGLPSPAHNMTWGAYFENRRLHGASKRMGMSADCSKTGSPELVKPQPAM